MLLTIHLLLGLDCSWPRVWQCNPYPYMLWAWLHD